MLQRPPISSLFPYTTLFRSYVFAAMGFYPLNPVSGEYMIGSPLFQKVTLNLGGKTFVISADRKSTRLNSSHVSISYAVFCLKKKNRHKYSKHTDLHCYTEMK